MKLNGDLGGRLQTQKTKKKSPGMANGTREARARMLGFPGGWGGWVGNKGAEKGRGPRRLSLVFSFGWRQPGCDEL